MKDIELPRKVLVGEDAITKVRCVIQELGLKGKALVVCDDTTRDVAGRSVRSQTKARLHVLDEVNELAQGIRKERIRYLMAVGGGRVIDAAKVAANETGIPYTSIPTAASHDGIASPQAAGKKDGKPYSIKTKSPVAIVADTEIIGRAPAKLNSAGCADAISNYTAVLDWRLAHEEQGEYFGDYAAALSMMAAEMIIENAAIVKDNVSMLVEALISNGVAMGIAGSSRPCSGSEHLFSHALDQVCEKPVLHGEQCGVGTILAAYLHKADWRQVKQALREVSAPTTAKELGVPAEDVVKALSTAHTIRERYTILRDGIPENEARRVAKATGVV